MQQMMTTHNTTDRFLMLLKTKGPQPASILAKELGITGEGARLQLMKLMDEGLIQSTAVSKGVGRPTTVFSLSESGNARFPDMHAELTVQLLHAIEEALGPDALTAVMEARKKASEQRYLGEITGVESIEERLDRLTQIRSQEGFMAEWKKDEEGYLFIENHCPVCAAAKNCSTFCRTEMSTFKWILGEDVVISRIDHIIAGARRCSYRIVPGA